MKFELGRSYSRRMITQELGGNYQKFLPFHKGKVVCGLFRKDLNPDAPEEILPGDTPEIIRCAKVFAEQKHAIPVFVRINDDDLELEYVGKWKVGRAPNVDPLQLKARSKRARRGDISMILTLEPE